MLCSVTICHKSWELVHVHRCTFLVLLHWKSWIYSLLSGGKKYLISCLLLEHISLDSLTFWVTNFSNFFFEKVVLDDKEKKIIGDWHKGDFKLYNHFKNKFQKMVSINKTLNHSTTTSFLTLCPCVFSYEWTAMQTIKWVYIVHISNRDQWSS